jgi:hypothetical protein
MRLTPHFTLAEFTTSETAARLGLDNTPNEQQVEKIRRLAQVLEGVRIVLGGAPIIITSGYRSPDVNARVGGSTASQHMRGEAVDFIAPMFGNPMQVCVALRDSHVEYDQLVHEFGRWVHLSIADKPRHMALTIDHLGTRPMLA